VIVNAKRLIVTWQDSKTRKYFPVGRLSLLGSPREPKYLFVYTKGIWEAAERGFRPFAAFPDVKQRYESTELFPFFANRLLPESREEREEFVRGLGLDPVKASPLEVLARSGGRRTTDSVETLALPETENSGRNYLAYFFLSHGLRHMPDFAEDYARKLKPGDELFLMHDLQNVVDRRALLLRTEDNCPLGFLPRHLLDDTWGLIENGESLKVSVEKINLSPFPIQQRVLCRMTAIAPEGFSPCSGEAYQPLLQTDETKLVTPPRQRNSREKPRAAG